MNRPLILFAFLIILSCLTSCSHSKPIVRESELTLKTKNFLKLLFDGSEEDILIKNIVKRQTTGQIIKVRKPTLSLRDDYQDLIIDYNT